jgi:hypothetical protein
VRADARPPALLAFAPDALVLADVRPPALLAFAPDALVLADALLAYAPDALVRADARPSSSKDTCDQICTKAKVLSAQISASVSSFRPSRFVFGDFADEPDRRWMAAIACA